MKWFTNMRVATKLISAFIIVAIIGGAMGVFGIVNMNSVDEDYQNLYTNFGVSLGDLGSAGIDFNAMRVKLMQMVMLMDEQKTAELENEIRALDENVDAYLAAFGGTIQYDNARQAYETLLDTLEQYKVVRDQVVELVKAGRQEEATSLIMSETTKYANETNRQVQELFEMRKANGNANQKKLIEQTDSTAVLMVVIVIVMTILSMILGIIIARTISKPVNKLVAAANRIADGDLNVVIDIDSKDEIGNLADSFRKMSDNLNDAMENIQSAAEQVAAGAHQISELSASLSQGATEQASSVEQLSASIEEIAAQTQLNADSSNEANVLAEAAKQKAIQGNNQMKDMLTAMDDINEASQNISKIIKVIDEIAFQTNILALNAAVEAARAGQHGKGFAVVAEEVRNLAARSANAAKETTELIEGSIKKAEIGTEIARDTATALQQIVDDVAKVAGIIDNIAKASNEQAVGINQINQGVMQVSQVVQTNSASLEEGAATSEELSAQAQVLKEQVNRFKLRAKKAGSYSSVEELRPELLELFEKMSKDKARQLSAQDTYLDADEAKPVKINLNDQDFGKY